MIKKRYRSIKNTKAYYKPCGKTSRTSNLLVVYLLEAQPVLSTGKTRNGVDFSAVLHSAAWKSGRSAFRVIKSFPSQYSWPSFKTGGPVNVAGSLELEEAWAFPGDVSIPSILTLLGKRRCGAALSERRSRARRSSSQRCQDSFLSESQSIKGNKSRRVRGGKEISCCYKLAMRFPISVTSAGNGYDHAGSRGGGKCTCSWALAGVWRKFWQGGKNIVPRTSQPFAPHFFFFFLKGILIILFSLNVLSTPGVNSGPKWLCQYENFVSKFIRKCCTAEVQDQPRKACYFILEKRVCSCGHMWSEFWLDSMQI